MQTTQTKTAMVIGGGLIGLACAIRLRERGLDTVLFEPSSFPEGASFGNAGHIAIEQVEPMPSWHTLRTAPRRLFTFGGALDVRDFSAFAPWAKRFVYASFPSRVEIGRHALRQCLALAVPAWQSLLHAIGQPALLKTDGHLVLWESTDTAKKGQHAWRHSEIGTAKIRDLDAVEMDAFAESLMHRPIAGMKFEGTAQIADVSQLLRELTKAFESAGGRVVRQRVKGLHAVGNRAHVLLENGEQISAEAIVVAAGVASADLLAGVGPKPPIISERGYHVQWPEHQWPVDAPPVVFEDRSMIVTRFHDGLRAAGFVEFAGPHSPPDPRKWQALRQHVRELGLPVKGEGKAWFGARPTLPDYLPAIGQHATLSNLYYAFGHQHLGLTLAPITAESIAALVCGDTLPLPITNFDLQRFH